MGESPLCMSASLYGNSSLSVPVLALLPVLGAPDRRTLALSPSGGPRSPGCLEHQKEPWPGGSRPGLLSGLVPPAETGQGCYPSCLCWQEAKVSCTLPVPRWSDSLAPVSMGWDLKHNHREGWRTGEDLVCRWPRLLDICPAGIY